MHAKFMVDLRRFLIYCFASDLGANLFIFLPHFMCFNFLLVKRSYGANLLNQFQIHRSHSDRTKFKNFQGP